MEWLNKWVYKRDLTKNLAKINKTIQEFYDTFVLNIDNIKLRPRCQCGRCKKPVKFSGFIYRGYNKFCSPFCEKSQQQKNLSKLGKHNSQNKEMMKLRSEKMKNGELNNNFTKKEFVEKRKNDIELGLIYNTFKDPEWQLKNRGKSRFISGQYFSIKQNKYINYDSSWELIYMIMLDFDKNVINYYKEKHVVNYINSKDQKLHKYFLDFEVVYKDRIELHEIKPLRLTKKQITIDKSIAAKKLAEELNCIYKFITEKDLELNFESDEKKGIYFKTLRKNKKWKQLFT